MGDRLWIGEDDTTRPEGDRDAEDGAVLLHPALVDEGALWIVLHELGDAEKPAGAGRPREGSFTGAFAAGLD